MADNKSYKNQIIAYRNFNLLSNIMDEFCKCTSKRRTAHIPSRQRILPRVFFTFVLVSPDQSATKDYCLKLQQQEDMNTGAPRRQSEAFELQKDLENVHFHWIFIHL